MVLPRHLTCRPAAGQDCSLLTFVDDELRAFRADLINGLKTTKNVAKEVMAIWRSGDLKP